MSLQRHCSGPGRCRSLWHTLLDLLLVLPLACAVLLPPTPTDALFKAELAFAQSTSTTAVQAHSLFQGMLAPRSLNLTIDTPAATVTRRILTPWPFVLGQCVVTSAIYAFQILDLTKTRPSLTKWAILQVINVVRGAGAAVWMLRDITLGGTTPSIGVALMLMNLIISSTAHGGSLSLGFSVAALSMIGYVVSLLGFGLYVADSVLSIVHYTFLDPSITVVVTQGCPSGLSWSDSYPNTFECAAVKPHYTYTDNTTGNDIGQVLWVIGAGLALSLLNFPNKSANSNANFVRALYNNKGMLKIFLSINLVGGGMAVLAAGLSIFTSQENIDDCSNVKWVDNVYVGCQETQLLVPGSVSGFWTVWARYHEEVIRSVFVW